MRLNCRTGSAIRRFPAFAALALISLAVAASAAAAQVPVVADSAREVTHTVRKGDTLWDIARSYLKNPFRWPEIFRRNTDVVQNPHWIYPGEVIRIPMSEVRPEVLGALTSPGVVVARAQTVARPSTVFLSTAAIRTAAANNGAIPAIYSAKVIRPGEIEAAPYIARLGGPRDHGEILAGVDRPGITTSAEQARYQLNDLLYVSAPGGRAARVGDRFLAYTFGPELEDIGQIVIPTAILQVEKITPGQPAQARVVRQFGEIRLRQGLLLAPPNPPMQGSAVPVANGLVGKVIHLNEEPILASLQHYIEISPTLGDGVAIGDEFTLIDDRMGRSDPTPAPPIAAAVVQVVRVTPYGSTAIIVSQAQPSIREGMPVRLTAKMR
jgi:LysM repeat protein